MENNNLDVGETIAGFVVLMIAPILWCIGKISEICEWLF